MMPTSPAARFSRLALQVLQGVVALAALIIGAQLIFFGAPPPSTEMLPADYGAIDGEARFLGGVWIALGALLAAAVPRIATAGASLRAAWAVLVLGGLAHNLGILRYGNTDHAQRYWAAAEVLVPLALGTWHSLLAQPSNPTQRRTPGRVPLQILVGLCALLSLYIGARALYFGASLPLAMEGQPGSEDIQGTLYFMDGIWLGVGVVFAYAAARIADRGQALRAACLVVLLGGVGRLWSVLLFGPDGKHVPVVIALEILLPLALGIWHYLLPQGPTGSGPAGFTQQPAGSTLQHRLQTTR